MKKPQQDDESSHIGNNVDSKGRISNGGFRLLNFAVWTGLFLVLANFTAPLPAQTEKPSISFLDTYCLDCHDDETKEGSLSLDPVTSFSSAKPSTWVAILDQLQLRQMPPESKRQPKPEERRAMVAWIKKKLREKGHPYVDRLELPNYGNYVDHNSLFHAKPHPAPATKVRIWRKRPEAYSSKSRGGIQPFSMVPGQQVSDFSILYSVDESSAEIILRNATKLVESSTEVDWTDGKPKSKPGTRAQGVYFPLLHPDKAPTEEEFTKVISWQFSQVLDRLPQEGELPRLRQLYDGITQKYGRLPAARAVLTAPMLMPECLYRLELGSGELDGHGRRRLSKHETIQAIHHTLSGTNLPNALRQASKKPLESREEIEGLVKELIGGKKPNGRILNFFDEYFDYRKANSIFKEPKAHLSFSANSLVREASMVIEDIVRKDKDVLARLLTTTRTYVVHTTNPPGSHRIYNLPPDWKWRDGLVDLAPEERAGILTHPAWLVAQSGNFDNDPVRRGKWILEHLLGGTVPDLPISVCAVVPEDESKTLRERFDVIKNDTYCWKCHQQMNPLGMPFEQYDHFGRFRLNELRKPVDTSGAVEGIGDPSVDGPVSTPVGLIHRLAKSERTLEVFTRYAFRFFLGRNETLRDAKTLQEAKQAYQQNGGSFQAMVISLLCSDSFLYRAPEL